MPFMWVVPCKPTAEAGTGLDFLPDPHPVALRRDIGQPMVPGDCRCGSARAWRQRTGLSFWPVEGFNRSVSEPKRHSVNVWQETAHIGSGSRVPIWSVS